MTELASEVAMKASISTPERSRGAIVRSAGDARRAATSSVRISSIPLEVRNESDLGSRGSFVRNAAAYQAPSGKDRSIAGRRLAPYT